MIIRDKAHQYLIHVLEKASGKHFSNLIDFISKVSVNEVDSIVEKAKQLVDEEVPKTYRGVVKRALSRVSKEWWLTLESPPDWLARAAYLYLLSETLGDKARLPIVYERLFEPEKVARHLPLYLSYGVYATVLLGPSKEELVKEVGREGISVDTSMLRDVVKLVVSRHVKVDVDALTVDILGRRIYYDEESFISLLDRLNMYDVKKEIISRAVKRELLPELARLLGLGEPSATSISADVRHGYTYSRDEIVINLPPAVVEQRYPELSRALGNVQAKLVLREGRLRVSSVNFVIRARMNGSDTEFSASYSVDAPIGLRECPRVILEKLDLTIKSLLKLREEMMLVRKLAEHAGTSNRSVSYTIDDHGGPGQVALRGSIYGELHGASVRTRYEVTVEKGEVQNRSMISTIHVNVDKRVASSVAPDALRSYLVGEGVKVIDVIVSTRKGYLEVSVEHRDVNSVRQDLSTSVKTISEYLAKLKESISALPALKDEHAVALYIYAKAESEKDLPRAFGRTFNEAAMRLGKLLSTIDPARHSAIKGALDSMKQRGEEANLLRVFDDVVRALAESGYLRVDRDGNLIINGARFTDILSECGRSLPQSFIERTELEALAKVIRATNADIIHSAVQEAGKVPDKVLLALEDEYLRFDPMFFVNKRVAGKPLVAYLPSEFIKKIASQLYVHNALQILTTPEYEGYFSEVKDMLVNKVLSAPAGIVTRYAFAKRPEIFAGVPVREVEGEYYDYMLEYNKWYCQVGRIGQEKHVFILYRKDVGVGVAFVARDLREALAKATSQYDEGVRVVNLLKASAPSLSKLGLTLDVYKSHRHGTTLLYLTKPGAERYYYVTPSGGNRLLDMVKEQETEVEVNA